MRYLIANWKLYVDVNQGAVLARTFAKQFGGKKYAAVRQIVCPSATELSLLQPVFRHTSIMLGAQNVDLEIQGPATGEISARDLRELGCRYVIVGHSERRAQGETDAVISKKLRVATTAGLTPILCVGEPAVIRKQGKERHYVQAQLKKALHGFRGRRLVVAYEPVWAISKAGKNSAVCNAADAETMRSFIALTIRQLLPKGAHADLLYGGSVSGKNISHYVRSGSYKGALVGFASTKTSEYATMIRTIALTNARLTQKTR